MNVIIRTTTAVITTKTKTTISRTTKISKTAIAVTIRISRTTAKTDKFTLKTAIAD